MTEDDYKEKLKEIDEQREKARRDLFIQYAAEQRKFNIGDIISNGYTTIVVEKFGTYVFTTPEPKYIGKELTKKLEPKKNGGVGTIFGNRGVELIKAASV